MMDEKLTAYQKHLVETHVALAQRLGLEAWRKNRDQMEKYEVVSIAYTGLIRAAQKFNPDWRPPEDPANYDPFLAFGAYAKKWISGAILEWQRSEDHVPKRQRHLYKSLREHGHGVGKTPEELAELTGQPADKIRAVIFSVEEQALPLDEDIDQSPYALRDGVETSVSTAAILDAAADHIKSMPNLQRVIVSMRHYSGLGLGHIAADLGVNPTTVRTLYREAMFEIHEVMRKSAH